MSEAPAIGIDLGTTYSCVGVFRHGKVEIICNDQGNKTTPSYVAFTNEERLLGDAAKAQEKRNLNSTIFDAKRLIGRTFNDPSVQADLKNWPFGIVNENNKLKIKIVVDGRIKTYFPEEISSMVLTKMKETAEAYLGKTVTKAVITVPAYFNDSQRQATKDAATIAKLKVLRIINEPTAAALAYGFEKKVNGERVVMIFDLGGGTFDVSILNVSSDFFEVLSTAGDTHLGGEDFDNRMVHHFVQEFKRKHGMDLTQNKKAIRRLKTACERAKRTLSSTTLASMDLDSLHEGIDFYTSISRARFEELNADLFRKTLEPVERAIRDAGLRKEQIQEIVLVGGSTRIPKVQRLVQDFFNGKSISKSINPDEAVAYGAALQAAILSGNTSKEVRDLVLVDVTPLSLGVEVGESRDMKIVVNRNTTIPAKQTGYFTTSRDNQTSGRFPIYEGEHPKTSFNNLLGSFTLGGIPPAPQGVPNLEAIFNIDADGILNVTAVDKATGNTNGITLTYNKNSLSKSEIQRMINEAEAYKAKEKKRKAMLAQVLAAKNSLELFCNELMNTVQDVRFRSVVVESDRKLIIEKCNKIIEWLRSNNTMEVAVFEEKLNELRRLFDAIMAVPRDDTNTEETLYSEVLNVTRDATEEEIREGYRQAARKFHPDKYQGDQDLGQLSQLMFRIAVKAKTFFTRLRNYASG